MALSRSMARRRKPASSYHHGDLRDALLAEALQLIAQRGLEELSLRELARRLGVSSAAPYHHFRDRTELLRALATQLWGQFEAEMLEARRRAGNEPLDRLRAIGRVYVRFVARHPSHLRVMFHREWGTDPHAEPSGKAFRVLQDTVTECLVHAGRRVEDPMPAILAMWGGVHGIAAICYDGPLAVLADPDELDSLCDRALAILVRALRP